MYTNLGSGYAGLGNTGDDYGYGIAVDSAGATIGITGSTNSAGWISGGWQTDYSGNTDAFVLKAIDASIAVGSLTVSLSPPDAITAGARWRRVGSTFWHDSGDTETHVLPGQHTIEFKTIYGWTSPDVHSVTVTADDTATDTGIYTIIPGSTLQVVLTPPEAVAAGAQWRRVGSSTWLNSGDTIYLPMGQYDIEFKPVPYWTAPEVHAISIPIGDTIVDTGNYMLTPIGGLQVTLTPPEAIAAGAQWRRVETSTWLNSGDTENNLFSGQYTIAFKSVYGWIAPDLLEVTVDGDAVTTATGDYTYTDPNVSWSTYLGGTGADYGYSIAVDTSGACYATGSTTTSGWVSGGWDTSESGGMDGYVVKLNVAGEHEWSTYLGGAGLECPP